MTDASRFSGRGVRQGVRRRMQRAVLAWLCVSLTSFIPHALPADANFNGFDVTASTVPLKEIFHGGPPRDGIPSVDRPKFLSAEDATYMSPDDRVMGLSIDGVSRAYPIDILTWHELVNDRIGTSNRAVVISYCPLCGSGVVFHAEVDGQPLTFGVSGLLYNSDMLLYDRKTESLWSQLTHTAQSGPHVAKRLTVFPVTHTTWSEWLRRHPETTVLSRDTGHFRDYDRLPYGGYEDTERLYFPTRHRSPARHPKEWVLGVTVNGASRAYPYPVMTRQGMPVFTDQLGGQDIRIHFDERSQTATVSNDDGPIPATRLYWFAWYAFHPDTDIYGIRKSIEPR
ncbi:MAG: DUF3179 domain-containing protein [Pseudomonadota bacterium]